MIKTMKVKTGKEFTENIIMGIFYAGTITIAAPLFTAIMISKFIKYVIKSRRERKNFQCVFSRLKKRGLIKISNRKGQIYISLTETGKMRAGKYQIDNLEIKQAAKWDKKWRILIFDIQEKQRMKREALRGKVKELGLFKLQDSVWIYPHDFSREIKLLRDFFGLTEDEMQIITASYIENDKKARIFFKLK